MQCPILAFTGLVTQPTTKLLKQGLVQCQYQCTRVIPQDNLNVNITFDIEQINVQLTNTAREQKIWNNDLFKVTSQCMGIIQTR